MPQTRNPFSGKAAIRPRAAHGPQEDHAALLAQGAEALGIMLAAQQISELLAYQALLGKWNTVYNLTAVRDPNQMLRQHLLDCLAAMPAFIGARRVLDVGAGGGLPGLVLAIWARAAQPAMHIHLVDTVHKKTAFLTQVKTELGLANVTVHTARVEQLQVAPPFDIITSRAFADLPDFINWSAHLLAPDGRFVAMKGVLPEAELAKLPAGWILESAQPLSVPMLEAQRHLLILRRDPGTAVSNTSNTSNIGTA